MGEDFCFLPKGKLIIKLPRRSPLVLRMIVLSAVVMCSICISSICLNKTKIEMKKETVRPETIEIHSYDSRLIGLNKTVILVNSKVLSKKPIEAHSSDASAGQKQTEGHIKQELRSTISKEGDTCNQRLVGFERPLAQMNGEDIGKKPMEELADNHSINCTRQTEIHINSESVGTDRLQSYGRGVMSFKQTQVQMKPTEQQSNFHGIIGSKQEDQIKPHPQRIKVTNQHLHDARLIGLNQSKIQAEAELATTNSTKPHCQDPDVPKSELPYVHYPIPTYYNRKECTCTPVRFYVIISMQRSGSKWLESLLNSHVNVSSYGEIFIDRERSKNVSALTRTLDTLYNLDWKKSASKKFKGCTAAVGFKWMINQGIIENHEEVSRYFKQRGVSVIFLFRRNLLRRLISLIANSIDHKELNGAHKAHVTTQQEANLLANYKPKLNAKRLVSKLKHASARATDAIEHFKSIRHMVLYYEDLVQNTTQKLTEVMEFLRVPQRSLHSDHVKIHNRPLSQMVKNWSAVHKALKGSPFESFLNT